MKKLSLRIETLRVLTEDEVARVNGGANGPSFIAVCVSNGPNNDCRSVTGECRTLPPLTTGPKPK